MKRNEHRHKKNDKNQSILSFMALFMPRRAIDHRHILAYFYLIFYAINLKRKKRKFQMLANHAISQRFLGMGRVSVTYSRFPNTLLMHSMHFASPFLCIMQILCSPKSKQHFSTTKKSDFVY